MLSISIQLQNANALSFLVIANALDQAQGTWNTYLTEVTKSRCKTIGIGIHRDKYVESHMVSINKEGHTSCANLSVCVYQYIWDFFSKQIRVFELQVTVEISMLRGKNSYLYLSIGITNFMTWRQGTLLCADWPTSSSWLKMLWNSIVARPLATTIINHHDRCYNVTSAMLCEIHDHLLPLDKQCTRWFLGPDM